MALGRAASQPGTSEVPPHAFSLRIEPSVVELIEPVRMVGIGGCGNVPGRLRSGNRRVRSGFSLGKDILLVYRDDRIQRVVHGKMHHGHARLAAHRHAGRLITCAPAGYWAARSSRGHDNGESQSLRGLVLFPHYELERPLVFALADRDLPSSRHGEDPGSPEPIARDDVYVRHQGRHVVTGHGESKRGSL